MMSARSARAIRLFAMFATAVMLLPLAALNVVAAELDDDYLGAAPGRFNSIKALDLDDDGNMEIAAGNDDGHFFIIENRDGHYYDEWRSADLGKRNWGILFGDIFPASEHELEMVGGVGTGNGQIFIWDATTRELLWHTDGLISDPHGIAFGDVDDDGKSELLVGGGYKTVTPNGRVYVFECGPDTGKDAECVLQDTIGNFDSRIREIEIFDIDKDGQIEIIFGSATALGETVGEGYINIFSWDGTRFVREWKSPDLNGCVEGLRIADVDSDGKEEMVVSSGYRLLQDGYLWIWEHDGEPGSTDYRKVWQSDNIGPKPYGLAVGDIDDDGTLEAVVGNQPGYMWIFDLINRDIEWKSGLLGTDVFGIDLADMDDDGDIEIIAGQGGYDGKGDWTSAYTAPHIYIIDGRTHQMEAVIGEKDYVEFGFTVVILLLIIATLLNLNRFFRTPKGGEAPMGKVQKVSHRRGIDR